MDEVCKKEGGMTERSKREMNNSCGSGRIKRRNVSLFSKLFCYFPTYFVILKMIIIQTFPRLSCS